MSENIWDNPLGAPEYARALTVAAYVERVESELAGGPTMADCLNEIRELDWGTVTSEDLIAEVRQLRDRKAG